MLAGLMPEAVAEVARSPVIPKSVYAFTEDAESTERPLLRYPLRRCIVELILLGLEIREGSLIMVTFHLRLCAEME